MIPDARITKVLLTWPYILAIKKFSKHMVITSKDFFRQKRHNEERLAKEKKVTVGHSCAMGGSSDTQQDAGGRGDL